MNKSNSKSTKTQKKGLTAKQKQRAEQRKQDKYKNQIRSIFDAAGFIHIAEMEGKEFDFKTASSDFDDIYVLDNILVILEYTTSGIDQIERHLLKKNHVYRTIMQDKEGFVAYLRSKFGKINESFKSVYSDIHIRPIILYCSQEELKESVKAKAQDIFYLDNINLMYFRSLTATVKKSAKYEMLDFLGITPSEFSDRAIRPQSSNAETYQCSILPEGNSHFKTGCKIITFYVDADALLKRAFVLRKGGWRTGGNIYQRMIDRTKVEKVRKHLIDNKGVFINNIIVTLPDNTKLLNEKGETIDTTKIKKTEPGIIQLSTDFNSIGIIDGQHRVFSYHEGGTKDEDIAKLRAQQNLLVTGIMFPQGTLEASRTKFEAELFLDINSTQTNARADLKQEIDLLLKPFAPASIARKILNKINEANGPLNGEFQRFFWEKDKLKTTTIVSYGLIPLVRLDGNESLINIWSDARKDHMELDDNISALEDYIAYCAREINLFVSAVRSCTDKSRWTAKRVVADRLLTTTIINGMIACVRQLANNGKLGDFDYYKIHLNDINKFKFKDYKSSHYNELGAELARTYF